MNRTLIQLTQFLRMHKEKIMVPREVAVDNYSPTYGADIRTEEIQILDFEGLLAAIDDFANTFKEDPK